MPATGPDAARDSNSSRLVRFARLRRHRDACAYPGFGWWSGPSQLACLWFEWRSCASGWVDSTSKPSIRSRTSVLRNPGFRL
jgi:hypothetical protein